MNDRVLRVPPHSIEAEQGLLGGLMIDPMKVDRVAARIKAEDFYRRDHQIIFRAIVELDAKGVPPDAITLGEWFEANGLAASVGGASYIVNLANNTPSAANIGAYVGIVSEKALARSAIDVLSTAASEAFDASCKPAELIDRAVGGLMALHRHDRSSEWTLRQAMKAAWDEIVAASNAGGGLVGIPSGLHDLDALLGGFHDSDLVVVAARPSIGKTALLFGAAAHAAGEGVPVGIVSSEQPHVQLALRMIAAHAKVPGVALRSAQLEPAEWSEVTRSMAALGQYPVRIYDRPSPRITELARVARQWKRQHGIRALYVDYLQRIKGRGEKRHEQVSDVAIGLKDLARELGIPVIALAQVKREVDDRQDKRPRMGDICDSSEIEKEADQVLTLYRDDYYHADSRDAGTAEILVDKNRHGPTGFVRVAWLPQTMRFVDLDPSWKRAPAPVKKIKGNPAADIATQEAAA